MTDEPFRWLEAIANRREYVQQQLAAGSPVLALSFDAGILLLGVGSGQSKVFEIFDRQAMAALGHPADIERVRQILIDAAHLEAFTRAGADVTLRRLVGFGLSPQLKQAFEQVFQAPFILDMLLAEVGDTSAQDVLMHVSFDGGFQVQHGGSLIAVPKEETAVEAHKWMGDNIKAESSPAEAVKGLLTAWYSLVTGKALPGSFDADAPLPGELKTLLEGKQVEAALLERSASNVVQYRALSTTELSL